MTNPQHTCNTNTALSGSYGYLTPANQGSCKVTVRVQEGQRINLTLHDFHATNQTTARRGGPCDVLATVVESQRRHDVCHSTQAVRGVFTSRSNEVDIVLTDSNPPDSPRQTPVYFLLEYLGT